jgi:hypothetical protein
MAVEQCCEESQFHLIRVVVRDRDAGLGYRLPGLVRALAGEPVIAPGGATDRLCDRAVC